jgi:hypothetical protein
MVQQDTATVEQPTDAGIPLDDAILKAAGIEMDDPVPEKEEEEDELPEGEAEADEADEEADGEEDSADEPIEAIKPPVSLNKEQRTAFEQLPPDLQKVWAETEAQRNEQVRIKTTEAAEATRSATTQAKAELAQHLQSYAAELEVYAEAFLPRRPDVGLLGVDPAAYAQEAALYEQLSAQHETLMQRVNAARGQSAQLDQGRIAEQVQAEQALLKSEWPEILDPAKQSELWGGIQETAKAIGFDPAVLANANATEMLALRKVSELKAKADRWDAFQARKMDKVRAAKELPRVSRPGTAPARQSNAQKAEQAFSRARTSRSGDDYAAYFEASGIKL